MHDAGTSPAPPLWRPSDLTGGAGARWLHEPSSAWNPQRVVLAHRRTPIVDDDITVLFKSFHVQKAMTDLGRGATAGCLVLDEPFLEEIGDLKDLATPILVVPDWQRWLRELAAKSRARYRGRIMAVTGTVGKTTTRMMLVRMLREHGDVAQNQRNLNLHAMVLVRMASARPNLDHLVLEIAIGQQDVPIGETVAIVRPHVSILTQLGIGHVDSVDRSASSHDDLLRAVLRAKVQIFDAMEPQGVAIVNADMALADGAIAHARGRAGRLVTYRTAPDADYRITDWDQDADGTRVEAIAEGERFQYAVSAVGSFIPANSLGALAAAEAVGCDRDRSLATLASFRTRKGRSRASRRAYLQTPFVLLDDSFSAAPLSLESGLETLAALAKGTQGRRIAVLGDISEEHLGAKVQQYHDELWDVIEPFGVDVLFTIGTHMLRLHGVAPVHVVARHFRDHGTLTRTLLDALEPGDVVLVKGANAMKLDRVIAGIREQTTPVA